MKSWLVDRLKEPTTWAGFSGLALASGMSEVVWTAVSIALAAIFSAVAVILKEKGKT